MVMKKLLVLLFVLFLSSNNVFSLSKVSDWGGIWSKNPVVLSLYQELPFYSDYCDDIIIVHNDNPDRPIDYQITDNSGDVLIKGSVSKENSAQIIISVSDLPDNGIYTIILTSPDPNDWVYSKFEK
jgi:hypothetical protein